jgi:hypothetical protein
LSSSGFRWPPPWGQDAWSWMMDFIGDSFFLFFFDYVPNYIMAPDAAGIRWPTPVMGRYYEINKVTAQLHHVTATGYAQYDGSNITSENQILGGTINSMHQYNFNRAEIWHFIGGDNPGLSPVPSVFRSEAAVPSGARNSSYRTWERTNILKSSANAPGSAFVDQGFMDSKAQLLINQWNDVLFERAVFTCFGDKRIYWGDVLHPALDANAPDFQNDSLIRNNTYFRVIRVEHQENFWDFGPTSFQTTSYCTPLSPFDIIGLQAAGVLQDPLPV